MSRSVGLLFAFVGLACTRPNPAFDPDDRGDQADQADHADEADELGTESGADTSASDGNTSVDTSSDGPPDTGESNDGSLPDLPPELCEGMLGFPLSLRFSHPEQWPNQCPLEPKVEGYLEVQGDQFVVRACDNGVGCSQDCQVLHWINAAEFDFTPLLGTCVQIEAEQLQAADGDGCSYGALSVFPVNMLASPIFVGTTRSAQPTFTAKQKLGVWPQLGAQMGVPTPFETCSCGSLDVVSDCCAPDVHMVDIYAFQLGDGMTIAQVGTHTDYILQTSNYDYSFYAAMAQKVGICSAGVVETSWKLFATGPF